MPKPASPWTKQAAAMTAAPTSHVNDSGASDNEEAPTWILAEALLEPH